MIGESIWTPAKVAQLRHLYVVEEKSAAATAAELGVSIGAMKAKASRLGLRRPREVRDRNLSLTMQAKYGATRPKPQSTHRAPVNFKAPVKPTAALPDRILSALRLRAMSAPSLASELNEKEMAVTLQLAAMAHAGEVQAGPALDRGPRHRVWRVTSAQYAQAVQTLAQEIAEAAAW